MKKILFLSACIILLTTHYSFSYIDPNLGSVIFQVLAGGVAGTVLVVKLFGKRIADFFKKLFGKNVKNGEDKNDETTPTP